MDLSFAFDREKLSVSVDDDRLLGVVEQNSVPIGLIGEAEVRRSLREPIGSPRLSELAGPGRRVAIVTSDITRPVPNRIILPLVLEEMSQAKVPDENITIVFALGSHRHHTEEEMRAMVGDEIFGRVHCVDSDMGQCVRLGTTTRGTPVDVFRPVAEADLRICIGNIEYHYFAGYSGGAKAILPGVSSREAIQANHSRMVQPEASAGRLEGNPVREDIDEVARFVPIDFIVNVVLDEHKRIVKSVAGDFIKAHRAGCAFLDGLYRVGIPRAAEIVIVSAGGYPKDLNMYQAQKALDNAGHAVQKGGIIIWVAACREGLGNSTFEAWMTGHKRSEDMIEHIRKEFCLGGHKAAAIAMILQRARIFLVSKLEPEFVRSLHLEPFGSVQEALDRAVRASGSGAKVLAMPYGASTLPIVRK